MEKQSIKSLSLSQLENFLKEQGEPNFRAKQIIEWLYKKRVSDFDAMTNLPKKLIHVLSSNFVIKAISLVDSVKSNDGTKKYIFESICPEIVKFESVAIPSSEGGSERLTVCISTQAGCPMACEFCATGKQGFSRNLTSAEIVDQILLIEEDLSCRVSNIVVMGQGEPFLNFENLTTALDIINSDKYLGIGARKITVSTCGIIPKISDFAELNKQYGLAISLHSAIQEKRNELMPGVKNFSLNKLHEAVKSYIDSTNRRPTFEYLMLKDVNDTDEDLEALVSYVKDLHCHINLIKYNNTPGSRFKGSDNNTINK